MPRNSELNEIGTRKVRSEPWTTTQGRDPRACPELAVQGAPYRGNTLMKGYYNTQLKQKGWWVGFKMPEGVVETTAGQSTRPAAAPDPPGQCTCFACAR